MTLTVFHYPACSTCRKALKWLNDHGIAHERVNIVDQPPSRKQLAQALADERPLRALFNTSGQSYRDGNYKEKLATLTRDQALAALAADGKLIKRPFAIGNGVTLVGFDERAWKEALT